MANRYANLVGSNKIKDEYTKINTGFDLVQADMDAKADASDLTNLQNTVSDHIGSGGNAHAEATTTEAGFMSAADKQKLDGIETGAEVNQNAFAKVNDVEAADPSDELTITGGTGITITTNPNTKEVIVTATGQSTPGPHGSSHTEHGADPIPVATTTEGGLMSADHVQMLESHSSRHAADGADPLTPEMIGAAPATHAIEHITGGSDVIPNATTSSSGLMSAADKIELGDLRLDLTAHEASKAPHIIPSVRVRNSANISIPNNSDTVLSFDTEQWDTDNMFDPANPTRLTARTAGKYLVMGNVMFSANNTGVRGMYFRKNGSGTLNFASVRQLPVPSIDTAVFCAGVIDLAVNDYVEMVVFQNSGASLNVGVTANFSPVFSMIRVGS